jgi:hypothetical protein
MADTLASFPLRFAFLNTVYESTRGNTLDTVHLDAVTEQVGAEREACELAMRWLKDEGLLTYATFGPTVGITHEGVRVVEEIRAHPDAPVRPFPAYTEMFDEAAVDLPGHGVAVGGTSPAELAAGFDANALDPPRVVGRSSPRSHTRTPGPESRTAGLSVGALIQARVSISPTANADVLAREDRLGFKTYVEALAAFLLSHDTQPPLTLSIEGEWGRGKSSFMRQLREVIQQDSPTESLCAQFNPWMYNKDEELWSAFALEFVRQAKEQLRPSHRFIAGLKLLLRRLWRREGKLGLLRGVSLVFLCIVATLVVLAVLQRAGSEWVDAVTSLLGWSPTGRVVTWLQVGGWAALGSVVVLILAKAWPYIKRVLTIDVRSYLSLPDYAARIPFVARFHEDFAAILDTYAAGRRAFIFVDDVDRCEPPRVADLMRAINLLIPSARQVVFVLGIDRAVVAASIAAAYGQLQPYLADTHLEVEAGASAGPVGLAFGRGFVEKFIQIPFAVPAPAREDMEKYIQHLAEGTDRAAVGGAERLAKEAASGSSASESTAREGASNTQREVIRPGFRVG